MSPRLDAYLKSCKAEVAHLYIKVFIDQYIVTLNVSVNYAQLMHVLENHSDFSCHPDSHFHRELDLLFFVMKEVEQRPLTHNFENDNYLRDFRHNSHKKCNVRVSQNALHHDFVVDLVQEFFGQSRIEYLFYCHRGAI